jgi:Rieske Fe-S protein
MKVWALSPDWNEIKLGEYKLLKRTEAGEDEAEDAFLLRIRAPVPGAEPAPDGNGYFVAFVNSCTHMGCRIETIDYGLPAKLEDEKLICGPCPCHGTSFDLARQGLVILGPATQNLPQLTINFDKKIVTTGRGDAMDPRWETWPEITVGGG